MRYLIIKTSAFGDVVQSYPVIQYIKSCDPDAQIDWVIEKRIESLVKCHPDVSRVISINAKEWKKNLLKASTWKELRQFIKELRLHEYEALFDLQGNSKSAVITKFAKSKKKVGFGWKSAPESLNCLATNSTINPPKGENIRKDYMAVVQSYFKKSYENINEEIQLKITEKDESLLLSYLNKLEKNPWMVCHGSQWSNKRYPEDKLISFLQQTMVYEPFFVFVGGNKEEEDVCLSLHKLFPNSLIVVKESLSLLQHLMSHMKLVISMDSLPLQLAGTTKTPTFSLFGPSASLKYRPLENRHHSFQGTCPYGRTFEKRCSILRNCPTGACLKEVSPDTLFSSFSAWLDRDDLCKNKHVFAIRQIMC